MSELLGDPAPGAAPVLAEDEDRSPAAEAALSAAEAVERAAAAVPAPLPPSAMVARRMDALRRRAAIDAIFAAEVADFVGLPFAEDGEGGVVALLGPRRCRVTASEVVLSHDSWPGAKRIPL